MECSHDFCHLSLNITLQHVSLSNKTRKSPPEIINQAEVHIFQACRLQKDQELKRKKGNLCEEKKSDYCKK